MKRTYCGAVLLDGYDSEISLSVRKIERKDARAAIGHLAAQLVEDGDIIIMDSSSSKKTGNIPRKSEIFSSTMGKCNMEGVIKSLLAGVFLLRRLLNKPYLSFKHYKIRHDDYYDINPE